ALELPSLRGVRAISGGVLHTVALRADGTVLAVGDNLGGQLGDGTYTAREVPVVVTGLSGITAVDAGGYFTLALRSDGTLRAWGSNESGQLGDGSTATRLEPVA